MTEPDRRTRRSKRHQPRAEQPASRALQPSQFFLLTTACLIVVAVAALRQLSPAALVFVAVTIAAAGYAAFMVFRTLHPLVGDDDTEQAVMLGGRTRAALERDKALTLRAIKELEFDHAMGKVAEGDFSDMRDRLRARALRLMRELEGAAVYREQIERDVAARLAAAASPDHATAAAFTCASCGAANETDARFCKMCGQALAFRG